jgi:uncharacterized membrane protein YbhN (UPF0104 family)
MMDEYKEYKYKVEKDKLDNNFSGFLFVTSLILWGVFGLSFASFISAIYAEARMALILGLSSGCLFAGGMLIMVLITDYAGRYSEKLKKLKAQN